MTSALTVSELDRKDRWGARLALGAVLLFVALSIYGVVTERNHNDDRLRDTEQLSESNADAIARIGALTRAVCDGRNADKAALVNAAKVLGASPRIVDGLAKALPSIDCTTGG